MSKQTRTREKTKAMADSIWSNPMVSAARNALSPEDLKRFEDMGKNMFNSIDYEESKILEQQQDDAQMYIEEQLKSGLHPSMMEKDEQEFMKSIHGDEWYKKWGYIKEDLDDIVTLSK